MHIEITFDTAETGPITVRMRSTALGIISDTFTRAIEDSRILLTFLPPLPMIKPASFILTSERSEMMLD